MGSQIRKMQVGEIEKLTKYFEALHKAYWAESIELLRKYFAEDNFDLNRILKEAREIDSKLQNRDLISGLRGIKGYMEDAVSFVVRDHAQEFLQTIEDRPRNYNEYLYDHYDDMFGDDGIDNLRAVLYDGYGEVAKIDHATSLQSYIAEIEKTGAYSGVELLFSVITPSLLFLLLQYGYIKSGKKHRDDYTFLGKLWLILVMFSALTATHRLAGNQVKVDEKQFLKSDVDKKYLEDQKAKMESIKAAFIADPGCNDPELIKKTAAEVEQRLSSCGYLAQ